MDEMEIDLTCIPDTPDRVAVRRGNSEQLILQDGLSLAGNSRNMDHMDKNQLRAENSLHRENRHNGRLHLHHQRNPINVNRLEHRGRLINSSLNGPLFRRASTINGFKHEPVQPNRAHHMEKGKRSCQQDDLSEIFDLAFPRGASKNCAEEKKGLISSSSGATSSPSTPLCSRIASTSNKGKEKIDISASNGFDFALNSGNVIDISDDSHDRNAKPNMIDISGCSHDRNAKAHLPDNSSRVTGQKRLVRNGCISPINIAAHFQKPAESERVGSMNVKKINLENATSDGPSQVDIREIVSESNTTHRGKGKEVIMYPQASNKDDAKAIRPSTRQTTGGWRTTNNHTNRNVPPLADLHGHLSGQDAAVSSACGQLENRTSVRDIGTGIATTRASSAVELTSESSLLGNSHPKRQKRRTPRSNCRSSLSVPDDSEIQLLGSYHGSSSSRSSTLQRSPHQGVLDVIYEIDESSPEMRSSEPQAVGFDDDHFARARQVEEDERLARELQEQLYHEAPVFGIGESNEDIALALQQEEDLFRATSGRIRHGSSFAGSSTTRSSRQVLSQSSHNSSNRRVNQVRAPAIRSRRSHLRSRLFNRPPTFSRDGIHSSTSAARRNIQFPLGMDLDVRLDILEALEAAVGDFSEMSMAMDRILDGQHDFNENDYEMLLALDENNVQHGVSRNRINSLPESVVQTDNFEDCIICLETPTIGDKIRHLPCLHKFHKDCIDPWLARKTSCPICKSSIT